MRKKEEMRNHISSTSSNGNSNYANKQAVNSSRLNTGKAGDKVCNIHDMASNTFEWSTEHCTHPSYSCNGRGGHSDWISGPYTSYRSWDTPSEVYPHYSFRPILYIK